MSINLLGPNNSNSNFNFDSKSFDVSYLFKQYFTFFSRILSMVAATIISYTGRLTV